MLTALHGVRLALRDRWAAALAPEGFARSLGVDLRGRIRVGDDVHLGVRTTILAGVTIGNRCVIGAGSVVTRDIPDDSVAAGVPARVIRSVDDYPERLRARSLGCGRLPAAEKAAVIRQVYGVPERAGAGRAGF
ncbi:DapH/DapD/GlmU-related protein [Micromonospora vulcania]|uniref:Acetyltransferase n=1 Tax=Micromonospora vulcania TaxID=1441873 RepID=A0ABW1H117_9ACTN